MTTEKKKYYSTLAYTKAGDAVVAWASGYIRFDLTTNESTNEEGKTTKYANAVLSVKNRSATVKKMVEAAGGNPDLLEVHPGKDGDEYVDIRLRGINRTAERILKAVRKGDDIYAFGRIQASEYNGKTVIDLTVNEFDIKYRNKNSVGATTDAEGNDGNDEIVELTAEAFDDVEDTPAEAEVAADDLPF